MHRWYVIQHAVGAAQPAPRTSPRVASQFTTRSHSRWCVHCSTRATPRGDSCTVWGCADTAQYEAGVTMHGSCLACVVTFAEPCGRMETTYGQSIVRIHKYICREVVGGVGGRSAADAHHSTREGGVPRVGSRSERMDHVATCTYSAYVWKQYTVARFKVSTSFVSPHSLASGAPRMEVVAAGVAGTAAVAVAMGSRVGGTPPGCFRVGGYSCVFPYSTHCRQGKLQWGLGWRAATAS